MEKWLRDQKFREESIVTPHELKIGPLARTQIPTSSNKIVDVVGESRSIIGEVQSRRSKRFPLSSLAVWVTRSRSKKKNREPIANQIVVDLDPGKETQVIMDQQVLNDSLV